MKTLMKSVPLSAVLASCALVAVGCSQRTDYDDVQAARENVQEEQRETAEVRNETAEDIAEARQNEQAVRHEAMKPVDSADAEDVRDAQEETAETRRDGAEAIQEEQKETAEAKDELRDTETKFAATKARDDYVNSHQDQLKAAADRIDKLEDQASNEEGTVKEATDQKVTSLQNAHDSAEAALDNLKSAELLNWSDHRDNVQQAFDKLQKEMDQTK